MRSKIRPILARGKFDSNIFNETINDLVQDVYDFHADLDGLITSAKSSFDLSNITFVALNGSLNDLASIMLESMPKPRYSIIRPYISKSAPLVGGNKYSITPISSSILHDYGVITTAITKRVSRFPTPTNVDVSFVYEDTTISIQPFHYAIRDTGWIAKMNVEDMVDITATILVNQDEVPSFMANAIELKPLINTSIKSVGIIDSNNTTTIIGRNISEATLLSFEEQAVIGVVITMDADDYLILEGKAYIGLYHFDLIHQLQSPSGIFHIEFDDPTSVLSVQIYLQDYNEDKEIIEVEADSSDDITWEFIGNKIIVETNTTQPIRYLKVRR